MHDRSSDLPRPSVTRATKPRRLVASRPTIAENREASRLSSASHVPGRVEAAPNSICDWRHLAARAGGKRRCAADSGRRPAHNRNAPSNSPATAHTTSIRPILYADVRALARRPRRELQNAAHSHPGGRCSDQALGSRYGRHRPVQRSVDRAGQFAHQLSGAQSDIGSTRGSVRR